MEQPYKLPILYFQYDVCWRSWARTSAMFTDALEHQQAWYWPPKPECSVSSMRTVNGHTDCPPCMHPMGWTGWDLCGTHHTIWWLAYTSIPINMLYEFELRTRTALIASFMGPTWGSSGADRTQVSPMLAQWILLSGWVDHNITGLFLAQVWHVCFPIGCCPLLPVLKSLYKSDFTWQGLVLNSSA